MVNSRSRYGFITEANGFMSVGGLCGAVFVDAAFEKHIKMLVGEQTYNSINERRRLRMLREFENAVKRCFSGDNKEYSVDLPGVEDDPDNGIDDGTIRIKPYDIYGHFSDLEAD